MTAINLYSLSNHHTPSKMGNQQSPQIKNRPLSSNKILVIGKGIYNVEVPEIHNKQMLQALKEGLPKFVRLQIYLKDADNELIPANPPTVQHPQFTFPLANDKSFSFSDYHYFLPNLESLVGLSIIASLEVPLSKEAQQSSLNSVLSYIGAASDVNSVPLGEGYIDLRAIKQRDVYNSLTVSIVNNSKVVAKIDLQLVKPGLKIDILELQQSIVNYEQIHNVEVTETNLFNRTFDRFVENTSEIVECRKAKAKAETEAQIWINTHTEHRIRVVSIDTTHTKSGAGFEFYSCNVWFKFTSEFLKETHDLEREKQERLKKEAELAKQKLQQQKQDSATSPNNVEVDEEVPLTDSETEEEKPVEQPATSTTETDNN
ncbi:hypothetical protein C9374_008650 [Naegleria lovaniensis]|uniref:Uncharacterized protein n=1 Tax=Naegleria lovaniensis TaxID=51637 RepID=A0AA88KHP0_NAELO|nr:uncharacterized protein C9374_008650 [Naegleria lovaniensis]KAG2378028.1 hypothetical protein C9374_008650 [Naegleria lovaniensis]